MRFGITAKLFVAVAITTGLVIAFMAFAMRYHFRHDFLNYINSTELNSLSRLADRLKKVYEEQGSWEFIRENPRLGRRMMRGFGRDSQINAENQQENSAAGMHNMHLLHRVNLLDEEQRLLVGRRDMLKDAKLVAVKSDSGQTIAWLSYQPATGLSEAVDIQFQQSQINTGIAISLVVLLFASLFAWILSRQFLSRIRQLATATRNLSLGELETRIAVKGQDEFGQLMQDFNRLATSLSDQEQARHRWLADISHELRTPVAVLRGEIEALQDGIRSIDANTLSSLHGEVLRINTLIDDLYQLALSDIGELSFEMTQLDLSALLKDVIESYVGQCQQKSLKIDSEFTGCADVKILGDENRMRQLFANLFQNSIRYTDNDGSIRIECQVTNSKVMVHWMDSKPGVGDEELTRLFDRLYRVDPSRSRQAGGAGLGLSICKNIVSAHGGTISATHSSLGGVCITVSLPRLAVAE